MANFVQFSCVTHDSLDSPIVKLINLDWVDEIHAEILVGDNCKFLSGVKLIFASPLIDGERKEVIVLEDYWDVKERLGIKD